MAKGEQGIGAGLLPEITPFPAPQIALAGLRSLAVEQVQCAAEIVSVELLLGDIHVRGVGPLAGGKFGGFGLLAQFSFFCTRLDGLLFIGFGSLALD